MSIGNDIGFKFTVDVDLYAKNYGSLILEAAPNVTLDFDELGITTSTAQIETGDEKISLDEVKRAYTSPLEKIFPTGIREQGLGNREQVPAKSYQLTANRYKLTAKPRIFIPVFPGTNCEYDSAKVWRQAGGDPKIFVIRNLTPQAVAESVDAMVAEIKAAQIIMLPGGFSGGDEPDGSGKFIAAMFRNPRIAEEVMNLLQKRDGLILGICNGFQALIKLGLLPYGEIRDIETDSPTLTHNSLGRHVSTMVRTRIANNSSAWLNSCKVGDVHTIAVSHGEGRFAANQTWLEKLAANGQIATQYVDFDDKPTADLPFNPNGSAWAIEGITSADGKIFGKMGHSERIGENVCKNVEVQKC